MSHIAEVKTVVKDFEVLKDILNEMGFKVKEGNGTVVAMDRKTRNVIAKVEGQEFGIEQVTDQEGDLTYNVVGEFYRSGYYGQEAKMAAEINRKYGTKKTVKELQAIGYVITENTQLKENADGSIEFVMSKY